MFFFWQRNWLRIRRKWYLVDVLVSAFKAILLFAFEALNSTAVVDADDGLWPINSIGYFLLKGQEQEFFRWVTSLLMFLHKFNSLHKLRAQICKKTMQRVSEFFLLEITFIKIFILIVFSIQWRSSGLREIATNYNVFKWNTEIYFSY